MNPLNRGIGIALVVIGLLVLLGQWIDWSVVGWPFFIIVPGVAMLAVAFLGRGASAGLAVPGAIVTTVGLVLLIQSATDTFESWAYAWGLVLASVGFGSFLQAALNRDVKQQRSSLKLTWLGLGLFAAFGVFFELFIFGGMAGWVWTYGLPIALIVAGAYLLFRRGRR